MSVKLRNEELGRMSVEAFKEATKNPLVLVLDNVRSLNNVGSAFRTADAFLVEEIFLCGVTGTPPNKEIEKTALGATASVKWSHQANTVDAVKVLQEKGFKVMAVEQAQNSVALQNCSYAGEKIALVFGNEVYGVEQAVIDTCNGVIEIPQAGTKHSLNVAVSIGVVLWEFTRKGWK